MFRKQPYWGWLLVAALLWIATWRSHTAQHNDQQLACIKQTVQQDLHNTDARFLSFFADSNNVNALFDERLKSSLLKRLKDEPYYLFAYQDTQFVFWSTNKITVPNYASSDTLGSLDSLSKNYCIRKVYKLDRGRTVIAIYPIAYNYYIENDYLVPALRAFPELENEINIDNNASKNSLVVASPNGKRAWLYITLLADNTGFLAPDVRTITLAIIALLASLLWVQLLIIQVVKRRSWKSGLALTVLFIVVVRGTFFFLPLPFQFSELQIFSADVYAYSKLIPSLGDLLLNELGVLWLTVFLLLETPYKTFFVRVKRDGLKWLTGLAFVALMAIGNTIVWNILSSLVLDSQISFDVYHAHNIVSNTVIVLIAICLGILISNAISRFLNVQISNLIPVKWLKYLLIAAAGTIATYTIEIAGTLAIINVIWLVGFSMMLDIRWPKAYASPLSLQMILLSLFSCSLVVTKLHYDLVKRDITRDRISFARNTITQEDPLMEYNFKKLTSRLQRDTQIVTYLVAPAKEERADIYNRFNLLYGDVLLNKYEATLSMFAANGSGIYNEDTSSSLEFSTAFDEALPTDDSNLHYIEDEKGRHYLSRINLYRNLKYLGQIFLKISPKKTINESVYPELLQPANISARTKEANYAYAIYKNGKMFSQTSEYVFPLSIDTTKTYFEPDARHMGGGLWEVKYQEKAGTVMIIAGNASFILHSGILLSYLFGLHLFLFILLLGYRALLRFIIHFRFKGIHLSLNRRIQLSMQLVVFVALFIVGIVTVVFFTSRYEKSNFERNKEDTYTFARFLKKLVASHHGLSSSQALASALKTTDLEYLLSNFAANEKRDVNIFGSDGRLIVATQEDIYTLGLLAPVINPFALQQMNDGNSTIVINEQIGEFNFQSCYTTLKNDDGEVVGYISIPFFSSIKDRNDQISNIIVALVNIYAVLFILSSLLALVITSRITRTFNLLKGKFETMSLQQNELIEWPYDDEIGALVKEYNAMVRKVEESAGLLAQSERESAWREMAKQVAHEIKNPLTPMKLNIQYLQHALKSNHPDVTGLAGRVSDSIIEQIDNLTYIASEFSNFAKMPEAHAEAIELNDLLQKVVALHQNEENIEVVLMATRNSIIVLADKSQLLRVFTNLLQNAVQAIPVDERSGKIEVLLEATNGKASISIHDNGNGISEDVRDRIFKPYFTTKSSGTGLGLAMTRKIIELWKGTIWFESVENEGTVFHILLPLYDNE